MRTIDTNKLRKIIDAEVKSENEKIFYKDAFSTGCYLHKIGKKEAGRKLCRSVLYSLGYVGRGTYFTDLLDSLEGNEILYCRCLLPHVEIIELFRTHDGKFIT